MFYEIEAKGHVRVHPRYFGDDTAQAVLKSLNEQFNGYISKDLGVVLGVTDVVRVGEGLIISGDGADVTCIIVYERGAGRADRAYSLSAPY